VPDIKIRPQANNMNKEFYENHFDNCDYCLEISESDRTDVEKDKLINDHTINDYAWKADYAYEAYKETI
jgi:hypothetical protein